MNKFKVGDWVRNLSHGDIFQITEHSVEIMNQEENIDRFELWKPKAGEWCWFGNKDCIYSMYGQFKDFSNLYVDVYETMHGGLYDFCEPFLRKSPKFLDKFRGVEYE